jgi:pimeloyl-ACP methyl ester carboxylesterase
VGADVHGIAIEAAGLTFDAVVAGAEGHRTVLLLHGFPQTAREWRSVMPALADAGYRAVAPDQRGYSPGARPPEVEAYAVSALVGDVLAIVDALGVDRVDLVGHDWGAAVAWQTAARFPERVRSLLTISVPHPLALTHALRTDPDQQRRSAYMRTYRQEGGVAERALGGDDWRRLREMYGGKVARDDVEHYVDVLSQPGALTAALNWYRAAGRADLDGVGPVTVPTVYVWGTEDLALGRTGAEATAEHVTGPYRFVELAGAGHWIPDELPDRLTRELLELLAGS